MLYFYKDFELKGVISSWKSLKWVRKYNLCGEFEIVIPFSDEDRLLWKDSNIVYKKDTDEAAFILDGNIFDDEQKTEIMIRGKFIESLLERRVCSLTSTETPSKLIERLINENICNPTNINRKMENVFFVNSISRNEEKLNVDFKNRQLDTEVNAILNLANFGIKSKFNPAEKIITLELYSGKVKNDVFFSKAYNNVLQQDYYFKSSELKTTAVVGDKSIIVGDDIRGIERNEVFVSYSEGDLSATDTGKMILNQLKVLESVDVVIDSSSEQFEYLIDWDLGDTIVYKSDYLGSAVMKNIVEVEEYWDNSGRHITVIFGDVIPTLK